MPETVTILEATAEANHHMAVQKATNIWKEKAKLLIPEKPGYLSEKSFRNVLDFDSKHNDQLGYTVVSFETRLITWKHEF